MTPRVRRAVRGLTIGGSVLFALTALVGWLHTGSARPLLAALGRPMAALGASCPLGYDRAPTPAERAEGRRRFSASHAGPARAPRRPALGFTLDATSRTEVEAWAHAHRIACRAQRSGELVCSDVAAALLGDGTTVDAKSVRLAFDEQDRLVTLVVIRRAVDAEPISRAFAVVTEGVRAAAGAAAHAEGRATPEALRRGALAQATIEYRFSDYYMRARATNLGDAFLLTEEYRSLSS